MLTTIPPEWISCLACFGGFLSIFTFRKIKNMVRSSLVTMFRVGMVILGPALTVFGILYAYFIIHPMPIDVRQSLVRLLLFYLFFAIDLWQVVVLKWGRNL